MPIINQVVKGSGGTTPARYVEKTVDANGKLVNAATTIIDLAGATDVGDYVLYGAYRQCAIQANTIDMSSLTSISGNGACAQLFASSTGSIQVDLSSLTSISGADACNAMFAGSGLSGIDLSSLTSISGSNSVSSWFTNCQSLTSLNLPSLTTLSGYLNFLVLGCNYLTEIKMNSLNVINVDFAIAPYASAMGGCLRLESVEFGGLTASSFANGLTRFQYMFDSYTGQNAPNGCTVHFPSNFDPSDPNHTFDASTLTGYPTFGGNASYIHVAFDLPATE